MKMNSLGMGMGMGISIREWESKINPRRPLLKENCVHLSQVLIMSFVVGSFTLKHPTSAVKSHVEACQRYNF